MWTDQNANDTTINMRCTDLLTLSLTYANDTQLMVGLNHADIASPNIQQCLEETAKWIDDSYLKLNAEKMNK